MLQSFLTLIWSYFAPLNPVPAGLYLAGTTCAIHETKISFDALRRAVENYGLDQIREVYTAGTARSARGYKKKRKADHKENFQLTALSRIMQD
jgi:hypothetical protein